MRGLVGVGLCFVDAMMTCHDDDHDDEHCLGVGFGLGLGLGLYVFLYVTYTNILELYTIVIPRLYIGENILAPQMRPLHRPIVEITIGFKYLALDEVRRAHRAAMILSSIPCSNTICCLE